MNKFLTKVRLLVVVALLVLISANTLWAEESTASAEQTVAKSPILDIMLVLDNSGSMKKNDPEFLTPKVVEDFIGQLQTDTHMGMIIFDQDARLIEPLMPMDQHQRKAQFLESLKQVNYQGQWTNSPAAIERAIYALKSKGRPDAEKVIIFLTDGIVDTGDKSQDRIKEKWLTENLTLDASKFNIRIFAIAFTENADFSLIQTLAIKTNGEYYRAYNAEEIASVFQSINDLLAKPKAMPDQASASVPKSQSPQKSISAEQKTMPQKESQWSLPIIIAGVVVAFGIIIMFMALRGKKQTPASMAAGPDTDKQPPLIKAELIDTKQEIFKESQPLLKQSTRIGRDGNNDIIIAKDTVSSLHATISFREGQFYLEDQRSTNKTFLQGKALEPNKPVPLKSGDEVKFDIYAFKFLRPDQAPAGATRLAAPGGAQKSGTVLRPKVGQDDASAKAEPAVQKSPSIPEVETRLKQGMCPNHPSRKATELCMQCKGAFCKQCMTEKEGQAICSQCAKK